MIRYREGDVSAFEALYARYKGPLYRYVMNHCRPQSAAADIFQDIWSRVIAARERYEAKASFAAWLYRIAHHCVIDHYRSRTRKGSDRTEDIEAHGETLSVAGHEQPDAQVQHAQLEDSFQQALAELPQEQRDVFLLFEESGLGLKEIAQIVGVPAQTVKSRLRYALNKLRRGLAPVFSVSGLEPAIAQTRVQT